MEWLLLLCAILLMLLCIPIAGKIEDYFVSEEHIHSEFYQDLQEKSEETYEEGQKGKPEDE